MNVAWYFCGMCLGFICGMEYIPNQLKKKNPKVIRQVKDLLEKYDIK